MSSPRKCACEVEGYCHCLDDYDSAEWCQCDYCKESRVERGVWVDWLLDSMFLGVE